MRLTEYQEFVIKTLEFQLNEPWIRMKLKQNGIKDMVKLMTRHYPEYTFEGKKAYQNLERYKKHHRITTRAAKVIDSGGTAKDVHPEHLLPNEQVFQELLRLCQSEDEISREDITEILSKSEMIIVSKEEAGVLDGNKDEKYPLDGKLVYGSGLKKCGTPEERLNAIGATFDQRYMKNTL